MRYALTFLAIAAAVVATPVLAQFGQDPAALIAAQKEAMASLAYMDGVWRGPAMVVQADGKKLEFTHSERSGAFLGDTLRVIEGRSFNETGGTRFNAMGIISFDPQKKAYSMRSYAMGHSGDFPITLKPDGYKWELPGGPNATIVYEATVKDGTWREVGDRVVQGKPPMRIFEMNLKRVGDTDWPLTKPVAPN